MTFIQPGRPLRLSPFLGNTQALCQVESHLKQDKHHSLTGGTQSAESQSQGGWVQNQTKNRVCTLARAAANVTWHDTHFNYMLRPHSRHNVPLHPLPPIFQVIFIQRLGLSTHMMLLVLTQSNLTFPLLPSSSKNRCFHTGGILFWRRIVLLCYCACMQTVALTV